MTIHIAFFEMNIELNEPRFLALLTALMSESRHVQNMPPALVPQVPLLRGNFPYHYVNLNVHIHYHSVNMDVRVHTSFVHFLTSCEREATYCD